MSLGGIAVATYFAGVILFFRGPHGLAKDSALYLSPAGGIVMVIGLVGLLVSARATVFSWPHPAVMAVSILGVTLFAYVSGFGWTGFLVWASLPYLVCILASCFAPTRVAAIAAVVVAMARRDPRF